MHTVSLPTHIQTEDKSFVRETSSHALLNTDVAALQRHRRRVASQMTTSQRLDRIEQMVEDVVEQMRRICTRLAQ